MRINIERKTLDIEAREINYILSHLVRSYLFVSKNEDPERIIFPMYASTPHPNKVGVNIPIDWMPPLDPVSMEIAEDGSNVPEVTSAQEAELDAKDDEIKKLRDEVKRLTDGGPETSLPAPEDLLRQEQEADIVDESASPAKAAFNVDSDPEHQPPPGRTPIMPASGDLGPGTGLSNMQGRDKADIARTRRELAEQPDIDEDKEKEFDKTVSKDTEGNLVVEDKPNVASGQ